MKHLATLRPASHGHTARHAPPLAQGVAARAALLALVALLPVLAGCSSTTPAARTARVHAEGGAAATSDWVAEAIRAETEEWSGTPYRLGGTTRRGVDCSGFTQRVFADVLDVDLTRSTRTQVREGERVSKGNLQPGDLVFFRPRGKGRHVGVYVGDGEFAHASTSRGPVVSPLARDYWQDHYWTARRVLRVEERSTAEATPAPSEKTASQQRPETRRSKPARSKPERSGGERTGW